MRASEHSCARWFGRHACLDNVVTAETGQFWPLRFDDFKRDAYELPLLLLLHIAVQHVELPAARWTGGFGWCLCSGFAHLASRLLM